MFRELLPAAVCPMPRQQLFLSDLRLVSPGESANHKIRKGESAHHGLSGIPRASGIKSVKREARKPAMFRRGRGRIPLPGASVLI